MKKITPKLCLLVIVLFSSCDGRDKAFRSAQNDLIDNEVLDTFTESVSYYPKAYTEMVTDTILSNGYNIHTKFYTDMDNAVIVKENDTTHYRDFIVDVKIIKEAKEIFNDTIDKSFLLEKEIFDANTVKTFLVQDFWIENIESVYNGTPALFLDFINPESKEKKIMRFIFLEDELIFEEVS
jgi:hypothetical protein